MYTHILLIRFVINVIIHIYKLRCLLLDVVILIYSTLTLTRDKTMKYVHARYLM